MNKNIELFKISTYNLKRENYIKCSFIETEIKNELINNNNSYHIQYKDTDDVIIFFDIDHVDNEKIFISIQLHFLHIFFLCDIHTNYI